MAVLLSAVWLIGGRFSNNQTVHIGDAVLVADIADTASKRERGLSGRAHLEPRQAMLFVFPEDGKWAIWMKNMRFAIDVVWLDANKKVVDIEHGVPPSSYPKNFAPDRPARYILELAEGTASAKNIRIGIQARFELAK